jgi:hypothetical protein
VALAVGGAAAVLLAAIALAAVDPNDADQRLTAADDTTDARPGFAGVGSGMTTTLMPPTTRRGDPSTGTAATGWTAYPSPATTVAPGPPGTTRTTNTVTTVGPPPGGDVVVTQDDRGKTISLRKGQRLTVNLQAESGWHWSSGPDSDNETVLKRESMSANPSSDRISAGFLGQESGTAHVSATKDANCRRSTPPCMVPSELWEITVNVAP